MATYRLNNLNFSFTIRRAPKSGPTSSDKWNDTVDEISRDLTSIAQEWNNKIVPIISGLPDGSDDTTVNAFLNGVDGMNLWVDQDVTASSEDTRYYNTTKARPNTVKEQFDDIYASIASEISEIQSSSTGTSTGTGLTATEKTAIGDNIFDASLSSTSTSLDGRSENNQLNILQIGTDLYGGDISLDNDGAGNLTNSVKDMVDALLTLHNGNWSDDITLSHTFTGADVTSSHPGDDTYVGVPADLEDDLNRIRNEIKEAKGTAAWQTANTALYAGGADSLEDLLTSTAGTGTKSATNPWGYDYDDVEGLGAVLDAIKDYTGQDDHTDSTPTYASTNYVTNGTSLETAIGALDTGLAGVPAQLAALETFTGQDNNTDSSPTYSSSVYVDGSLENAIGQLDLALSTVSGIAGSFLSLSDTPSSYTGYAGYYPRVNLAESALEFASSGILFTSMNGTVYMLTVDDAGVLITTAV